ncbi:MAG: carbohydrate kinase family protein [Treponema sp.]|jgi:sugar/nucleoside kinase (ribokinase family)|nr:carbohydrate kinase family protein [Treponema sp.]
MADSPKFDVLALGELNVDLIVTGLKEAPVLNREIIARGFRKTLGSSTALCGANLAKLGLKVGFCGKVGDDENGRYVIRELRNRGIDTGFCKTDPSEETGVTLALNWNGDRALVTVLGTIGTFSSADFDTAVLKTARHIHVGSFFLQEALRRDLARIFKTARDYGVTTSLDAGWDDTGTWDFGIREVLKYTDIFFPNETEALNITKKSLYDEAAGELEKFCATVVIKRGKNGAYCTRGGKTWSTTVYADVNVVDTTGAGDSFNAGFIYGFVRGLPPEQCLEYGNACGNLSVGVAGGANADLGIENVKAFMKKHGRL